MPPDTDARQALDAALQHHRAGRPDLAEPIYRQAVEADPRCAEAWHLLGVIELQKGRPGDAVPLLERSVALDGGQAKVHNNLASAYDGAGRPEAAEAALRRAADLDPGFANAHYNLGLLLQKRGATGQAEAAYRRALDADPNHAEALNNLGVLAKEAGGFEDAVAHYERAAAADGSYTDPLANLGTLYGERGLVDEATAAFQRLLAVRPDDGARFRMETLLPAIPRSTDEILAARTRYADALDRFLEAPPTLADPMREGTQGSFYLAYHGLNDRDLQVKLARLYARACPALEFVADHCRGGRWQPGRRLRLGFVSGHLYGHTIGKLTRGFVAELSREQFEVFTFFFAKPDDPLQDIIRARSDAAIPIPRDFEAARRIIAEQRLDIVFFPDIGMEPFTYFLAFSRLAPVQCMTWGHPVTTGIETIDYFVSSDDLEPEGAEAHYSERLVRLSRIPTHYYPPPPPARRDHDHYGLPAGASVYVCPQTTFKLHPDFDNVFADILRRDPKGLIVLIGGGAPVWRERLTARFRDAMPDVVDRVRWVPPMPLPDFLGLIAVADVMIDPTPFAGGNTTLEALAIGTPVVTIPGRFMRGRPSYAMYRQMGLLDCVADTVEDYVAMATGLATDAAARADVQARIRATRGALYEDPVIVGELERFLVEAVDRARSP